jgi:hypothetical protein
MILSTAETADIRAIFPQKPLQFLRIQPIRDLAEVHETDRAGRQKSALTKNLSTPVLI